MFKAYDLEIENVFFFSREYFRVMGKKYYMHKKCIIIQIDCFEHFR